MSQERIPHKRLSFLAAQMLKNVYDNIHTHLLNYSVLTRICNITNHQYSRAPINELGP